MSDQAARLALLTAGGLTYEHALKAIESGIAIDPRAMEKAIEEAKMAKWEMDVYDPAVHGVPVEQPKDWPEGPAQPGKPGRLWEGGRPVYRVQVVKVFGPGMTCGPVVTDLDRNENISHRVPITYLEPVMAAKPGQRLEIEFYSMPIRQVDGVIPKEKVTLLVDEVYE